MVFVANSVFQNQMAQQYQTFRKDPAAFLGLSNVPQDVMADSSGKAAFEYMTGQKIPDEYANNPMGYAKQVMNTQMNEKQRNTFGMMMNMFQH